MDLRVRTRSEGGWSVIELNGDVDMFTAPAVREAVERVVGAGASRIVIDLDEVASIDSTGLGAIVDAFERVRARDGRVSLVCSSRPIKRLLAITGVDDSLAVYPALDDALAG